MTRKRVITATLEDGRYYTIYDITTWPRPYWRTMGLHFHGRDAIISFDAPDDPFRVHRIPSPHNIVRERPSLTGEAITFHQYMNESE